MRQSSKSDSVIIAIGNLSWRSACRSSLWGLHSFIGEIMIFGEPASKWIDRLWLSRSYFEGLIARLWFVSRDTVDQLAIGSFICRASAG
jgi:hypothetical protein